MLFCMHTHLSLYLLLVTPFLTVTSLKPNLHLHRVRSPSNGTSSNTFKMGTDAGNEIPKDSKRLVLIRHGCTHMNEYLSKPGSRWGDAGFTDVFPQDDGLYRDSPLSDKGTKQAQRLKTYFESSELGKELIGNIELVAVSPMKRALQTAEIGVLPHLSDSNDRIPIVALPLASERLYLVSDLGSSTSYLSERFPFADFTQEFNGFEEEWWFTVKEGQSKDPSFKKSSVHSFNYIHKDEYVEWRPKDEGQEYACLGEPDEAFQERMVALYRWLEEREERVICLVCHWGVLDWLVGAQFENCEVRDVSFHEIRSHVTKSGLLKRSNDE